MSYLGFCGTLGADYIQYMIADDTVITAETRPFYTENILYMPHSYFVNDHKQVRRHHAWWRIPPLLFNTQGEAAVPLLAAPASM